MFNNKKKINLSYLEKNNNPLLDTFRSDGIYEIFKKNKMVLAGGAIIHTLMQDDISNLHKMTSASDYDFYFKDKKYIESFMSEFNEFNDNLNFFTKIKFTYQSNNAISCEFNNFNFQFITLDETIKQTTEEIISQFDFTVCQGAYDFEFDKFVVSNSFIQDNNNRKLCYNIKSKYPVSSLFRIYKYKNKGYYIPTIETLKIALSIERLHLKTYGDVAHCLNGISTVVYEELVKIFNSELYIHVEYNLEDFIQIIDDYFISQEIIKELTNAM